MGHGGNMGYVDFKYFCDNLDVVNYSDNEGDNINMIRNIFFYQVTLKKIEIWGFLLRIDVKLC